MKIVSIKPEQFDEFASKHKYKSYYQSSAYGNLMSNFEYSVQYLGILNNANVLIGATLLLYKPVFMNYKTAYAPRGILFNYEKADQLKDLVELIKKTLGKKGIIELKIDPYIPSTIRDKDGNIINFNNQTNLIMANLQSAGFSHKGKTLFFEDEKPRWESLTLLNKDIRSIYDGFNKSTKAKISKALNLGVEVYKANTNNLRVLYEFGKETLPRPYKYYVKLVNNFKDKVDLYYAKINTEVFVFNSRKLYEEEVSKNDLMAIQLQEAQLDTEEKETLLNKKMESDKLLDSYKHSMVEATQLLKDYPKGIIIAGALIINYDNSAYVFIDGSNKKYDYLSADYLIKWKLIETYQQKRYKYVNFNGVVGEFERKNKYSNLNESKLGFNSIITEYIGEFDIVLNNFAYKLYKSFNKDKK